MERDRLTKPPCKDCEHPKPVTEPPAEQNIIDDRGMILAPPND